MPVFKTIRNAARTAVIGLLCFSVSALAAGQNDFRMSATDSSITNPIATGEGLFSYCRSQPEEPISAIGFGVCLGFIEGIVKRDAMLPKELRQICLGESTEWGDEYQVVVNFLRDHPKNLHLPGRVLALSALSAAFPCVA